MVAKVLYVIVCGARPAGFLADHLPSWKSDGWDVCVIVTPSALKFVDLPSLAAATAYPVRHDYKQPDQPDVLPPADAMVIAPATFNTINKLAHGSSDTLALGLLNEAIGGGTPIIAVPTPGQALARHPVFAESVISLRSWGVDVMFDPDAYGLPAPDITSGASDPFPWTELRHRLRELQARLV